MSSNRSLQPERRTPQGSAAGVIDTISDAVTVVIQRPWLMVVPLLIDLVLWLVLHVTMNPVIDGLINLLESTNVDGSDVLIEELRANGDQILISDYLGAFVPGLFTGIPLDSVFGALMLFVAPDGFGIPRSDIYTPWANGLVGEINPSSSMPVLGYWILSLLGSSVALVAFRVPLARAIRATQPTSLVNELATSWMHFVLYLLVLLAVAGLAFIPIALVAVLVPILGLSAAFVLSFALLIFGGLAGIYTYFAVDAMLIHRINPVNAFRMSYAVAKQFFGQSFRFILTNIFLMLATAMLWSQLASTAPGLIIALVGSAFIGTVLAAASMMFYTDRFRIIRALEMGNRSRVQSNTWQSAATRKE